MKLETMGWHLGSGISWTIYIYQIIYTSLQTDNHLITQFFTGQMLFLTRDAWYTGIKNISRVKSDGIIYRGLAKYRGIPYGGTDFNKLSSWHNLLHLILTNFSHSM